MLERVDRVQMAVADAGPAARAFQNILGAEVVREEASDYLNAQRTILTLGASEVELCAPRGAGIVRAHLDRWGPGLLTAGFSVASVPALRAHLIAEDVEFTNEGDQTYLEPGQTSGMRVVISPLGTRPVTGLVHHLYEVTNTIGSDWTAAARHYSRIFGLDPARFSPIHSDRFGYTGTLTLFDPPARLDRIEISQVTDPASPMGRWAAKRGDSLYMCYAETGDVGAITRRLNRHHARFTPLGWIQSPSRSSSGSPPRGVKRAWWRLSRRVIAPTSPVSA